MKRRTHLNGYLGKIVTVITFVVFILIAILVVCVSRYVLLSYSTDFPHGTEFSTGYNEEIFTSITPGDPSCTLLDKLGTPFSIMDFNIMTRVSYKEEQTLLYFTEEGYLYFIVDVKNLPYRPSTSVTFDEVLASRGHPDEIKDTVHIETHFYSRSPRDGNYKKRVLYIDKDLNIVVYKDDNLWTD